MASTLGGFLLLLISLGLAGGPKAAPSRVELARPHASAKPAAAALPSAYGEQGVEGPACLGKTCW
jgi:hypothetical protein